MILFKNTINTFLFYNNTHSTINIELEYFKSLFGIEGKYSSISNLKTRILNPSFEDFKNNNDTLNFEFIGIKKINNIDNIKISAIIEEVGATLLTFHFFYLNIIFFIS